MLVKIGAKAQRRRGAEAGMGEWESARGRENRVTPYLTLCNPVVKK